MAFVGAASQIRTGDLILTNGENRTFQYSKTAYFNRFYKFSKLFISFFNIAKQRSGGVIFSVQERLPLRTVVKGGKLVAEKVLFPFLDMSVNCVVFTDI